MELKLTSVSKEGKIEQQFVPINHELLDIMGSPVEADYSDITVKDGDHDDYAEEHPQMEQANLPPEDRTGLSVNGVLNDLYRQLEIALERKND